VPFVGFSRGKCALVAAVVLAMGVSACRASVKAKANVNSAEVEDDRKWEVQETPTPVAEGPSVAAAPRPAPRVAAAVAAPAPSSTAPFYGVTHDLSLAGGAPRAAACRCLAVVYGPPSDGQFAWQAGAPADHDAVAIAITSDGVGCNQPSRVSIAGVEHEGTDIVLVVENVGEGRPIMRGALSPNPGPGGAIVVRTRHGAPYPSASGAGGCRIAIR
jgi:hypothetical protein